MTEFNLSEEKKKVLEEVKLKKENSYCSDCFDCFNCSDCSDCFDCFNCSDCSDCSNCSDKKYMIKNVQFTKKEYEAWKKNLI